MEQMSLHGLTWRVLGGLLCAVESKSKVIMKTKELIKQSVSELREQESQLRKELFELNFQHSTRQLTDTSSLQRKRRDIARLLTVLKEKEFEAAQSA